MTKELPKAYEPQQYEDDIYKRWEESGFFNPDVCIEKGITDPQAEPFSIVLPPPNVTGTLHIGHAVMLAIEDVMVRYHRMKGDRTLWVPGTDHAAIATQEKVERILWDEEKKTRHDLGRDEFLDRVNKFASDSHDRIVNQAKKMGTSMDWSREYYSLDEERNLAVRTAFKTMYDAGLIYRGDRIVNWDPKMQSNVSDIEVVRKEEKAKFYYFQYGPFVIGTSRPETKFGDKYVVMHPDDERYAKYKHGDTFECEWINGPIKATILKDEAVDPAFGTGVMTITPWHDATDFFMAERHGLDKEQVIDFNGNLLPIAGEFAGMNILDARPKIVEKLEQKGLLVKTDEDYIHSKATNSRGGGLIEPQIMKQWWVDVTKKFPVQGSKIDGVKDGEEYSLQELMQIAVQSKQTEILPERFEKTYFHWIDNLQDWCLSRQLWFGHRVPAWYKRELGGPHQAIHFELTSFLEKVGVESLPEFNQLVLSWGKPYPDSAQVANSSNIQIGASLIHDLKEHGLIDDNWMNINKIKQPIYREEEVYVGIEPPEGDGWIQDSDTLDTWFSAGLFSFSPLGWPDINAKDLRDYHPTSVLETGYDIIFFWVARMILMSSYLLGEVPFKTVYLHGLVRDEKGRKMSKSLDNIIDPLDVSEKFGTDAVRLSLIIGASPGNDSKLSEEKIGGFRNFANKLWNISRFTLLNIEDPQVDASIPEAKTHADKWILEELENIKYRVKNGFDTYNFSFAGEQLRDFTWNELADWYLEIAKIEGNKSEILNYILNTMLKLWHPFMPFVTEAIWQEVYDQGEMLMVEKWPETRDEMERSEDTVNFLSLQRIITNIRSIRGDYKIDPVKKLNVLISAGDQKDMLEENAEVIKKLARLEALQINESTHKPQNAVGFVEGSVEVFINLEGVVDFDKEKSRLQKEIEDLTKYVSVQDKKLSNAGFVDNAPAEVVAQEKEKLAVAQDTLTKLQAQLTSLN